VGNRGACSECGCYNLGMRRVLVALLAIAACSSGASSVAEVSTTEPTTTEPTTTQPTTPEPTRTEPATTEPITPEPTTTEPITPEPTTPEPTTEQPTTTESAGTAPPARDFTGVDAIVTDFVAERGLNGAGLIVVDATDGVVHEQYWGEFDADRVSLVASSSKQITAGVLLHLQDQGLIDLDAPVADAVPWGDANPDITPAQLLSSRSGLVGLLQDPSYPPYRCQFLADGDIEDCAKAVFTTTDDDADQIAPDTEFRYGGAQWQVAGGVAEAVSGKPWALLIEEIYVEPCELETLGYNNHWAQLASGFVYPDQVDGDLSFLPPTDNPNMEGGAYLNVRDYGKLLQMHLVGGRCGDVQVLSPASLAQMYADALEPFGGATFTGGGYGMGWWVDRTTGLLTDPGAYGSVPWLDLEDGYGAYLVIELDSGTGTQLADRLFDPVERAVLTGRADT
jgi:CubicO group peptidase (beta-lactamase class C family)